MKLITVACIFVCTVFCGCATAPVIGPFSYMTSQNNKKAFVRRAALRSRKLTEDEKRHVVTLSAYTTAPTDIGMLVKIDVLELMSGKYTTGELFKQGAGVAGDVTLYSAIIYGFQALVDANSDDGNSGYGVNISGDHNNVYITQPE